MPQEFRLIAAAATLLFAAAVVTIPNPIQRKFKMTLAGQADHLASAYPDDRRFLQSLGRSIRPRGPLHNGLNLAPKKHKNLMLIAVYKSSSASP
jgi:hypothetical protein